MPTPKEVFENPEQFLPYLQSPNMEGQCFERKEVRIDFQNQIRSIKEEIIQVISGFANSNRNGGLLVLGIADNGDIKGLSHIAEKIFNGILQAKEESLRNHSTQTRELNCQNEQRRDDRIYLLYTSWTSDAICETTHSVPKAWKRNGPQCLPLTDQDREQLKRDKKIVDFESRVITPYDPNELDEGLTEEFIKYYLEFHDAQHTYSTQDILYQAGAIVRQDEQLYFTNSGYLFFAANPRRLISNAYIRLMRFDSSIKDWENRGLPIQEKEFDGPPANMIRKIRTYIQDSAFFRKFSKRNSDGGFTDQEEYPFIAIDEAIVNAIIHRDYGINTYIECSAYRDAFIVINPGNIPQNVPQEFDLGTTSLDSIRRNSKLVDWMRVMRDERGTAFVRSLSEGTKTMLAEMEKMELPAPHYRTGARTVLTLYNNLEQRDAEHTRASKGASETGEYTNLFPIKELYETGHTSPANTSPEFKSKTFSALRDILEEQDWFIDNFYYSRLVAHPRNKYLPLPDDVHQVCRIYPAYIFQFRDYGGELYLCIDYKAELKNVRTVGGLLPYMSGGDLLDKYVIVRYRGHWERGKIEDVEQEFCRVHLFRLDESADVGNNQIIPDLSKTEITALLKKLSIHFDLDQKLKEYSLASQTSAAKLRSEKTLKIAEQLFNEVFPIKVGTTILSMAKEPAYLLKPELSNGNRSLTVYHDFDEPAVEFYHGHDEQNILDGLSKYGSFEKEPKDIEIIPVCVPELRSQMEVLIERLQIGKFKYKGSERAFGTKFTYQTVVTAPRVEDFLSECKRLIEQTPNWVGDQSLQRIFLVYLPEDEFPVTDVNSPYYSIKELMLKKGIPIQMVNTRTLRDPNWKDFNLALNIIAKCKIVPWVLPDELPDADFFVGLSYTQHPDREINRLMGFANIFNSYGRWQFSTGNANAFNYEDRHLHYTNLVKSVLNRLSLSETPSIHFHYSAKFSKQDREVILKAARSIRPNGKYSFVWINTSHSVRFYDSAVQSDGSLSRGAYVIGTPYQFYLSTTGYNIYKKALGTPQMLEVNIWTYPKEKIDHRTYAKQLIYLTKLNWASTQSLCGSPITIKYARDIARLTSVFLERNGQI